MSGIVGIWNRDGQPVSPQLLARMSATLAHRGPDGEGRWISGAVGLACQLLRVTPESAQETQPLGDAARGLALVFDGRLDNREELAQRIHVPSSELPSLSDSALLLAAYRALGERLFESLNGDFAFALYDASRGCLFLVRDPLGVRPLYYCEVGRTLIFGSEIKPLLAHPNVVARPNEDVLAEFLMDRLYDPALTFFNGVFSLRPAHMALITPDRIAVRRYWDFDPSQRLHLSSFHEYVEVFRGLFEQAVRRRLRSNHPVALAVSGGVDSSSIFCMAESLLSHGRAGCPALLPISFLSPEGSPSDEQAFLNELERAGGTAIARLPASSFGLPDESDRQLWHIEVPFLDELWGNSTRPMTAVRQQGARVLITGHWGDQVLFNQPYLIDLVRQGRWLTVAGHLREFGRWLTDVEPRWFRRRFAIDLIKYHVPAAARPFLRRIRRASNGPWYTPAFRQRAFRRVRARRPPDLHGATVYARAVYEEVRAGYHVFCMEWSNKVGAMHGLEQAFPFLDRDLIAFLMQVPGEMHAWQGVPKALLREAMRGLAPAPILERRWKADFTNQVNQTLVQEFSALLERLQDGRFAQTLGYVQQDRLTERLEPLRPKLLAGTDCQAAWVLWDLLSMELWLQVFFDSSKEEPTHRARKEEVNAAV